MASTNLAGVFQEAVQHHQAGRLSDAERLYRQVLAIDSRHADSLNLLGVIAHQVGRHEVAIDLIRKAIAIDGSAAPYQFGLGNALRAAGRPDEALGAFAAAIRHRPDFAQAHSNLGTVLVELGRLDDAVGAFATAIRIDPTMVLAQANLGNALYQLARFDEAVAACDAAIRIKPDFAEAHNNRGNALYALGRFDDAVAAYHAAIRLKPNLGEAHYNLGNTLRSLGRLDDAVAAYNVAARMNPGSAETHYNLGNALRDLGRYDEALAAFDRAANLAKPRYDAPLVNKANLLAEMGQAADSVNTVNRALAVNPRSANAWHLRCRLKIFAPGDPDIAAMEKLLSAMEDGGPNVAERTLLHFALGKAWMDIGDADRAFAHLEKGNRLKRATFTFDAKAEADTMSATAEYFAEDLPKRFAGAGDPSAVPIFIIGMPRSGTTLVEQILASHSAIHGAGELAVLPRLIAGLSEADRQAPRYPQVLSTLTQDDIATLGRVYLARVTTLSSRRRIVDKMPINFHYAGLIHLMLPNARIIHCRRDPMDTCWSCYANDFVGDLNFAYDLTELGLYYQGYERLMAHWRRVLPPDRFLDVAYESVVDDMEAQARRLIAFCGLEWEESCLDFHLNRRHVGTASTLQVRTPLFRDSIGRWKPFARHLGPLLDALDARGNR
jgi:tetratricopeptide (TPR) repeat protein